MPYKDKKKQAEYQKKYRKTYMKPYMRKWRQFRSEQQRKLQEAISKGKLDVAKEILKTKPSINILGTPKKRAKKKKN